MAKVKPVSIKGVTCMSWNKDCSMIALSPNSSEVHIFKTNGSKDNAKWESKAAYILTDHSETVSSIDWSKTTNFLLTCSHDRNAYVWTFKEKEDKWEPDLVLIRINRAATMCRWSPLGNKFAVASSAKCVPICYYEEKHNWWVSKAIRKHKSTVLSVAWCPNNKFIVTGATDFRCRILSAYMLALDSEEDSHGFGDMFKKQHEFGEVLAEFDQAKAWVHDVAWSPNAYRIAFTGHGSTIHFVQLAPPSAEPEVQTVRHNSLPYLSVEFLSNKAVVASGFDQNPHVYVGPDWKFVVKVDKEEKVVKKKKKKFGAALSMFESASQRGESGAKTSSVLTKHLNSILEVHPFYENSFAPSFATAGIDGRVICWNLEKAGLELKDLRDE